MSKGGYVYIITNKTFTVLYTGVTSDLLVRTQQHKEKYYPESFTARYNCCILVYYKFLPSIEEAIEEEKRIKGGNRKQKIKLITEMNAGWKDLWEDIKLW
ncbi:MAG: GIY-YIG nuclease family protein [Agriterribacter sp.]